MSVKEMKQKRLAETSQLLSRLQSRVDSRIRPNILEGPLVVNCSFHLISLGSISELDMAYTMDINLNMEWVDENLIFGEVNKSIIIPPKSVERMWTPDIYFPHEKSAYYHDITVPNKLMKIYPNGTVAYSLRITLRHSCPMLLYGFPMDTQHCFFRMESYAHGVDDIHLFWTNNPVAISDDLIISQFDLISAMPITCRPGYRIGDSYPCLTMEFILHRQIGFYLLQTYVPCVLIVILSWVSFWINVEAVPARISLGVTTVLTMATQLTGARANAPKVSYPKAIDVWMAMCMIFVFSSLLEYAFANVISRRETHDSKYKVRVLRDKCCSCDKKEETYELKTPSQNDCDNDKDVMFDNQAINPAIRAAQTIDYVSRFMFPGTFVIFNVFYWSFYYYRPFHLV